MTSMAPQSAITDAATEDLIIQVRGLRKKYGELEAVRRIDFEVQEGEVFGIIGPDGAGKTTAFQILSGVMEASGGDIQILGKTPRDARLGIGYLTQRFSLYLDLSLEENLRYSAGLREVPEDLFLERSRKYLKLMDLDKFPKRLAGQLSGGMKQKLALCCALIAQPKVLLLDEPTTGVDPLSRREFWDVLATLADEGVTMVVATPYLDEAERCDRIALMYGGQFQQVGTPDQLRAGLGLQRLEVRTEKVEDAEHALTAPQGADSSIIDVQTFGDRLDVLVKDTQIGEAQIRSLLDKLDNIDKSKNPLDGQRGNPVQIVRTEPTLENVFVTHLRQQGSDPPFIPFPRIYPRENHRGAVAIYAQDLSKSFGDFQAVKDVDLEIHYGEIYGLLGANGAGKTTTIKMLCGLLASTAGKIALGGETSNLRSHALRRRIGYMSQKFTLYDDLTIVQNLEFYGGVYGVPHHARRAKIDWVLDTCGLTGQEGMLTGQLPGGWKQRVAFGASVMHEPEILFLDEPTSGVDPLARRQFWRLIENFAHHGTAVLVTTHYLEEAEHCHQMSFMAAGETITTGSPSQIKAQQPGQLIEVGIEEAQAASRLLKTKFDPWRVSIFADYLHVVLDHPEEQIPELKSILQAARIDIRSIRTIPFSLEDAFIGTISRALGQPGGGP
jgi:ABC-2 type transport system ATP-binding protein